MPTNYIEIAPISSPPRKRKRTETTITSPPNAPPMFSPVMYPFMLPGHPLQWMPVMTPVLGLPPSFLQSPAQKPLGQCTITKVSAESSDVKSPVQELIAQVDAITPTVRRKSAQPAKKTPPKESSSTLKKQTSTPIVIEPIVQKKNKAKVPDSEVPFSEGAFQELRPKISMQHAVLVHDLQALQQVNSSSEKVREVCKDYFAGVSSIETQRSHALIVATDLHNRHSIEFYYDKKRNELIESTTDTLKKLKSNVKVPIAWSAPSHRLPLLSYVTDNCETNLEEDVTPDVHAEPVPNTPKSVEYTNAVLNQWYEDFRDCPYASNEDVAELSQKTGLTVTQVRKWLGNRRLRDKDSKVRLRKYDSKIILGHLRRRNKQKKEQLKQQQKQQQQQEQQDQVKLSESSNSTLDEKVNSESQTEDVKS